MKFISFIIMLFLLVYIATPTVVSIIDDSDEIVVIDDFSEEEDNESNFKFCLFSGIGLNIEFFEFKKSNLIMSIFSDFYSSIDSCILIPPPKN